MPVWLIAVVLYIAHLVGLLAVAISGSKKPAATLTWLTFCLVVPFLGLVVYLLLTRKVQRRSSLPWEFPATKETDDGVNQTLNMDLITPSASAAAIASAVTLFSSPPVQADLRSYISGEYFYQDLVSAIQGARSTIDIEFYIFRYDEVGQAVVTALLERLQAGVKVRFLLDGFGSRKFPQHVLKHLTAAGAQCRIFFPIRFPFLTASVNHRDHCKIVVIDHTTAFTGGMNVGREYAGWDPSYGPWRDTHVKIEAKVSLPLGDLFEANFELGTPIRHTQAQVASETSTAASRVRGVLANDTRIDVSHADKTRLNDARSNDNSRTDNAGTDNARTNDARADGGQRRPGIEVHSRGLIQFLQSGPDTPRQNLRELYFLCLTQATRQVDITTPYFLPESDLLMGLYTAVARGVRVRLLLPEQVDHRMIGYACQTYFPSLLHAGVEIYLRRPGVLHAKVMTVDQHLAVVGAANYDLRSFRLNYEVAMVQYGEAFVEELRQQFEMDLEVSRRLEMHELHQSVFDRMRHNAARLLAPLM
ncbi:hypothetical protein JZ785_24595 [Alicyclobacillus curvatus]|nr:hypothetical protein JZ785_24595 [Alicyclobacillus curvatus]